MDRGDKVGTLSQQWNKSGFSFIKLWISEDIQFGELGPLYLTTMYSSSVFCIINVCHIDELRQAGKAISRNNP